MYHRPARSWPRLVVVCLAAMTGVNAQATLPSIHPPPPWSAIGVVCPGKGDCCAANGSPGCEDRTCCDSVCAVDAVCCTAGWDGLCAQRAGELCPDLCSGGCPGTGDCCQANGTPGCSDPTCCELVCADDPACCGPATGWDALCASKAEMLCTSLCSNDACPGTGDCCVANGTPGCTDQTCCEVVCAADPLCCSGAWDALCASEAQTHCVTLCSGDPCPGVGDCCTANGTAGCDDEPCCELVCASDPTCCSAEWDTLCASEAQTQCMSLCSGDACPGAGDCCNANGTAGCDDEACCAIVCASDPTCCDPALGWDTPCVAKAEALCGPLCSCPGEGDCCQANGTDGCTDPTCCGLVCTADPTCCDPANGWGAACVARAEALCGALCSCPGTEDCCLAHGSAGCVDESCCDSVCMGNPACCDPEQGWTQQCAQSAWALCGVCTAAACCFDDGTCADLPISVCLAQGGASSPLGTVCSGPCPGPVPASSIWGLVVGYLLLLMIGGRIFVGNANANRHPS